MFDRHTFRGKLQNIGTWVEGYLSWDGEITVPQGTDTSTGFANCDQCAVDIQTIGQCTEVPDKNGVLAFGGDVVKTKFFGKSNGKGQNFADYDFFAVTWLNGGHCLENSTRRFSLGYMAENPQAFEIVGNLTDNPELVEVAAA